MLAPAICPPSAASCVGATRHAQRASPRGCELLRRPQFSLHLGMVGSSSTCNNFFKAPVLPSSNGMVPSAAGSAPVKTAIAVVGSPLVQSLDPSVESINKKYYFVVANAKFMLDEEEHFKELLFERLRNYGERSKEQDFWLVIEPKFLDKFPNISRRLGRPAVALVSTNGSWITFMKLRLDRVLSESYEADSLEEALGSNPAQIEFEKPESWSAPYPKYEFGWWEPFLPPGYR